MKHFSIPQELLMAVGNYLVTRPYQEVAQLIRNLETQCKEIKDDQKSDEVGTPTPSAQ